MLNHESERDRWEKYRAQHQTAYVRNGRTVIDPKKPMPLLRSPELPKGKAPCFCCGANLSSWDMPHPGSVFEGGDSYGSRIYDSMVDGIRVWLVICDDCLTKNKARLIEWSMIPPQETEPL